MEHIVNASSKFLTKLEGFFKNNLSNFGKLLIFFGTMFGFFGVLFSKVSHPESVNSFILIRGLVNCQLSYQIMKTGKVPLKKDQPYLKLTLLRSFFGIACTYTFVMGVQMLDLNHFTSLFNTSPIFTFIFGYYLMGEIYSHSRLICTLVSVIGVILVVNPHFIYLDFSFKEEKYENFYTGCFLAILSAFLKAIIWVLIKKISAASPFNTMLIFESTRFFFPTLVLIFSQATMKFTSIQSFMFAILSGFSEFSYHIFGIAATRYEKASVISIFETLGITYSFFFDIFVYHKTLEIGSFIGSVFIICSTLYLTISKM